MKRILIIYAIFFVLTIIVPAIVCFAPEGNENKKELLGIFNSMLNLVDYYH